MAPAVVTHMQDLGKVEVNVMVTSGTFVFFIGQAKQTKIRKILLEALFLTVSSSMSN